MTLPFAYSVEREYDQPISRLWSAWTDAASLEQWYSPTSLSVVPGSVVSEAEVGGVWCVAVAVPDLGYNACFFGQYTKVEPNSQLCHTMHYTQSEDEFAARDFSTPHHDVVVDFETRGERTWVRFAQFGVLPEGQAAMAQAGMESYFDSLAAFLAR